MRRWDLGSWAGQGASGLWEGIEAQGAGHGPKQACLSPAVGTSLESTFPFSDGHRTQLKAVTAGELLTPPRMLAC